MKTLMMVLGLAALMTAPALAQSGAGQPQFQRTATPSTAHEAVGRSDTFYGAPLALPPDVGIGGGRTWTSQQSPRLYPDGN